MTDTLIGRLRELLAKATPGEWHHVPLRRNGELIEDRLVVRHGRGAATIIIDDVVSSDDARLIAATKTALPTLLDTIETLTAENKRLREARDGYRELLRQALNALACSDKNDPLEPIADNGMTVWDGMRAESARLHHARATIGDAS